jgi:hypothetical protein
MTINASIIDWNKKSSHINFRSYDKLSTIINWNQKSSTGKLQLKKTLNKLWRRLMFHGITSSHGTFPQCRSHHTSPFTWSGSRNNTPPWFFPGKIRRERILYSGKQREPELTLRHFSIRIDTYLLEIGLGQTAVAWETPQSSIRREQLAHACSCVLAWRSQRQGVKAVISIVTVLKQ